MDKIREDLLHFIWENQLLNRESLFINHELVEIIDPGYHNKTSGPDFFNARIRIGNTLWAGNVEIHVKASDWFRHNHEDDPSYLNVILHVVWEYDCDLERPGGEVIPCLVMKFDTSLADKYRNLVLNPKLIPCSNYLPGINKIYWNDWYSKLMIERLQEKTAEVDMHLSQNKYNWEETLFFFLGRSFGLKINSFSFENLVRTTPLNILLKFRKNSLTINACLFGQSGFLEDLLSEDSYYIALQREYHSMVKTLPPRVLDKHTWKFMGTRPGNFPLTRIAQFASLIASRFPLFSELVDSPDIESWREVLKNGVDTYWEDHYLFGKSCKSRKLNMGKNTIDLVILNAFIPLVFHYATVRKRNELKNKILYILEKLPPENNNVIMNWKNYNMKACNAFESQALIQLTTKYCRHKRCLECLIGSRIIKMG